MKTYAIYPGTITPPAVTPNVSVSNKLINIPMPMAIAGLSNIIISS